MNAQAPQSAPEIPVLPGAAVHAALEAFLAKKIELRKDGDTAVQRGSHQGIAVLAAVAAAAPFLRGQEPSPEAAVRAAAEAAYESVRPVMNFPTGFADAPPPLQARYMDMQRAALAAAAPHLPAHAQQIPELVGYAEIATIAGVSRQRARELSGKPGFPPPAVVTASGPLRVKADVERWLASWDRSPGRPRTTAAADQ